MISSLWPRAIVGLCLVGLTACQTTGMAPTAPPPAPAAGQPVMMPATDPVVLRERESRSQRVTSTGALRTETRSSRVSVDPGVLVGTMLGAAGVPAGTFATPAQVAGVWNVQQPDGATCKILLRDQQIAGQYTLSSSGCSDPRLASARGWTLGGGTLRIAAANGQAADLTVQAANRAEGSGFVFWR